MLLLTETWHTAHSDVALRRCVPPGYTHVDAPRACGPGGGVTAVVTDRVTCRVIDPRRCFTTFESICFFVTGAGHTVFNLIVYRPGSTAVTEAFFTELTSYLEVLALYKCPIVTAGDFNIHAERHDDPAAIRLADIMYSFDCIQHVPLLPTHTDGGTIDLVYTKSVDVISDVLADPPGAVSDHSLIHWRIPVHIPAPHVALREVRSWRALDEESFRSALHQSDLYTCNSEPLTADEYFERYDTIQRMLVDEFVPVLKLDRRRQRLAKWMDSECFNLRRHSRRLEKQYRRTLSADDRRPGSYMSSTDTRYTDGRNPLTGTHGCLPDYRVKNCGELSTRLLAARKRDRWAQQLRSCWTFSTQRLMLCVNPLRTVQFRAHWIRHQSSLTSSTFVLQTKSVKQFVQLNQRHVNLTRCPQMH